MYAPLLPEAKDRADLEITWVVLGFFRYIEHSLSLSFLYLCCYLSLFLYFSIHLFARYISIYPLQDPGATIGLVFK